MLLSVSFVYSEDINNQTKIENTSDYDQTSVDLAKQGVKTIDLNSTDTWEVEKYNNKSINTSYWGKLIKNPDGIYYLNITGMDKYNETFYESFLLNQSMLLNTYPKMNYNYRDEYYYFLSRLISFDPSQFYLTYYYNDNNTVQK